MESKKPPREMSESGMIVYPQLPVPKQSRESDPRMPYKRSHGIGFRNVLLLMVIAGLGGAVGGFIVRPLILEDSRLVEAQNALAKEKLALSEANQKVAGVAEEQKQLDEQRVLLNKQLEAAKEAQERATGKVEDREKLQADLEAAKKKLGGSVIEGDELRLTISTGSLFKTGDDLSPGGQKLLDRVATALKELPDKNVTVHGHTDDTPPPKPRVRPAKKDKKAPAAPPPEPPEPEFATNWELSSARALAVVHYLQDKHKIEASRLSAMAHSQYRPVSKNKNANRRIELVLSQRPAKK